MTPDNRTKCLLLELLHRRLRLYGFALKAPRRETGDRRATIRYAAALGDNHSRNGADSDFIGSSLRSSEPRVSTKIASAMGPPTVSGKIRKTCPAGRRAARLLAG
jgi:hypothetical protein